jgi:hypothetical protein
LQHASDEARGEQPAGLNPALSFTERETTMKRTLIGMSIATPGAIIKRTF